MKKTLPLRFWMATAIAFAALCAALNASAQRGEMTIGINGGYATRNDGGYTNLYFQFTPVSHVRIAPEIGYIFRNEGKSAFNFAVDVQFPFKVARGVAVYPLTGFVFNSWKHHGHTANRAGVDFGGGFDFYLTNYLKLTLQGKYSLLNDYGGGFFGMGIGYVF